MLMYPKKIIVAGIGTDVGKTIASAVLVKALNADYWKPIQCGNLDACDTETVKALSAVPNVKYHQESYRLPHPLSPHHAARLSRQIIYPHQITLPITQNLLVIECAGGLLVPITDTCLQIDLLCQWDCVWILVSKHYLGSINHTLLSLEALKKRNCPLLGIIFSGKENPDSERVIMHQARCPLIGRLFHEAASDNFAINSNTIERYATQWKPQLSNLMHNV